MVVILSHFLRKYHISLLPFFLFDNDESVGICVLTGYIRFFQSKKKRNEMEISRCNRYSKGFFRQVKHCLNINNMSEKAEVASGAFLNIKG